MSLSPSACARLRWLAALVAVGLLGFWLRQPLVPETEVTRFGLWLGAVVGAALACAARPQFARPDFHTGVAAGFIALGLVPRLFYIEDWPLGVLYDEALHPLYGLDVLRQNPMRAFDGVASYFATPYLDLVLQAWPGLFLPDLLGGRLASTALAVVSLAATFALVRRLYTVRIATFALALLAVSYWHITYSRLAHPYMQPLAWVPLTLWLGTRALRPGASLDGFATGLLLGLGCLLYTPTRIVVPIYAVWWILCRIAGGTTWRTLPPIIAGAALSLAPFLLTQGLASVLQRYREATAQVGAQADEPWTLAQHQLEAALGIYWRAGAWVSPHDVSPLPMLDPATALLAVIGMGVVVAAWRSPGSWLVGLWLGATFVAAQLLTDVPQAAYRAAPLLPAIAIVAGLALDRLTHLVTRFLPGLVRTPRPAIAVLAGTFAACLFPWNWSAFATYANGHAGDMMTTMARFVGSLPPEPQVLVVSTERVVVDERFRLIVGQREARDVLALADVLGELRGDKDVLFVWHPELHGIESVIRRCYPQAQLQWRDRWDGLRMPSLWVERAAQPTAGGCASPPTAGLRARYFASPEATTPIVERIEDWPMRAGLEVAGKTFHHVEWSGQLEIPQAGQYDFIFRGPSGSTGLQLGGDRLHVGPTQAGRIRLPAGPIDVRIGCVATADPSAGCLLYWATREKRQGMIPPTLWRQQPAGSPADG